MPGRRFDERAFHEDLAWIDRMSLKYVGQLYQRRSPREVFTIEIDRVGDSGSWGG